MPAPPIDKVNVSVDDTRHRVPIDVFFCQTAVPASSQTIGEPKLKMSERTN